MAYKFLFDRLSNSKIEKPIFLNDDYIKINNAVLISIYKDDSLISETAIIIKKKLGLKIGQLLYEPFPFFDVIMLNSLMVFLKNSKCVDFLTATPNYIPFKYTPKNSIHCVFGSYRINLNNEEENLFANMHKKVRQYIRKAEKENLEVLTNINALNDSYPLIKDTLIKAGILVKSYEEICALYEAKLLRCWTVYYNNEPQSTLLVIYNLYSAYTFYTATIKGAFPGVSNYIYWKAMIELKSLGVKSFDFSGARISPSYDSKIYNIQKFKERLGGVLYEGYMWKIIFNPIKYKIYINLIKIYSLIHGVGFKKDIIDQELQRNATKE
jgi:hypothetical protein